MGLAPSSTSEASGPGSLSSKGDARWRAPYLDAVVAYGLRGPRRYHVPGHKGGLGADPALREAMGERALMLDIPRDIVGVDLGDRPTAFEEAEMLAAEAYGARRTWFLTNGATQGNHALALACAPEGTSVLIQRNCHASVIDGLVLSGGRPHFLVPEYDEALGLDTVPSSTALADRLTAGRVDAVFLTSPTYFGSVGDIAGCADVCRAAQIPLVVDQSWGPHFGFHADLPDSALAMGADAVLTSTHKIAGSLTQSAMLHVARGSQLEDRAIDRALRLLRSTSPSSLLMLSLDGARRQLAVHGERLLGRALTAIEELATIVESVAGCSVIKAADPLKFGIDVRGTGLSGHEIAARLRQEHDIHVELATQTSLLLVFGIGEPPNGAADLAAALAKATARGGSADPPTVTAPGSNFGPLARTPRQAMFAPFDDVPLESAVGRVACELIAGYPPGIAALVPGELVTSAVVDTLRGLQQAGVRLHGASDPDLRTICVMREDV